jgi:hypothetical protein
VPRLLAGAPLGDTDHYLLWQVDDVKLFYPAKLRPKPYADRIRIRLRSFLFMKWLDLEGARAIVSPPAAGFHA